MFERILVCLDGSSLAEQILPLAEAQARQFKSRIILLQIVVVTPASIVEAGATYFDAKAQNEHEKVSLEKARKYLQNLSQMLNNEGVQAEAVVIEAPSAGKAILEYAQGHGINLIAIATHGHGGLGRMVFGSVAEYVLRESGLPMLLIRPKMKLD